jgi:mRNA interferase MazF
MIRRGEIYYANLSPVVGSEQGGRRPVLVVQNNRGNHFSPTVICAPITKRILKKNLPTQVPVTVKHKTGPMKSMVLLEQIRTIDKERILHKICALEEAEMEKINRALLISIGVFDEKDPVLD